MGTMEHFRDTVAAANRLIDAADFHGAVRLLREALADAEARQDLPSGAMVLNRIGRTYWGLGNAELAIRYHLRALDIFEGMEDVRGMAETYNYLGVVWARGGNPTEALRFKRKGLEAALRSGDPRELSRAYNNMGEDYRAEGRYAEAREQYRNSLELDRQEGNKAYEAVALHNLARVASAEEQYADARELFEQSLALSVEALDREMEVETLVYWGSSEVRARRYDAAETLLTKALDLAESMPSSRLLAEALAELANFYRKQGNFVEALDALERFTDMTREEFRGAQAKRLLAVSIEMEVEQVREEARKLASEAQSLRELVAEQVREINLDKERAVQLRDRARETLEEFLLALASAIEAKDPCTGGHGARVAGYSRALAHGLGLPSGDCQSIYLGAIVHDVGKIGIPDALLNKPGGLDPEERAEMRRHAAMGYEILSRIHGLETAAEIAHCHQERWDGGGYPRGLRGTDIPLPARIVTIADVWDGITSHRPYRPAMALGEARRIMVAARGKIFDPDLFDIFMEEKGRLFQLYRTQ